MSDATPSATSSIEIHAAPDVVYSIITDLAAMSEVAEETAVMRWRSGATGARPGAVFTGTNRNGWRRWTTRCIVTDADRATRFAFNVSHAKVPIARWQYDIATTGDGCTVTESTWDRRPGWYKRPASLVTGTPNRQGLNNEHIQTTLRRLKARAESAR